MKHFLLLATFGFFTSFCPVAGQQQGELLISKNTLKQSSYSYEVDQYMYEHFHPERFSNSGWKYHGGDNMEWKEPSFNDNDWAISTTNFIDDTAVFNSWQGIGWYRLKLKIDSSLWNNPLALVVNHYGASEIYLDGKLINQYGIPSADPAAEKIYHPFFCKPIIINLDNQREHLLTVRYSFLSGQSFYRKYKTILPAILKEGLLGFSIHFGEPDQAVEVYRKTLTTNLIVGMITLSVLMLIVAYHLFLYRYYARERTNLYIAIFNFVIGVFTLLKFLPTYARIDFGMMIFNDIVLVLLGCLWLPSIVILNYSVVYKKLPKYLWLYLWWVPFYIVIQIYDVPWQFFVGIVFLTVVDVTRLLFRSLRLKQHYAWIISVGVIISQIALTLWGLPWDDMTFLSPQTTQLILLYFIFLAVPLAMSVYNALTLARTSLDLENQLNEVRRLSLLSLSQEQEKQQILASQNETLEELVRVRTGELNQSVENLKSTQSLLIQSEKMASLGELTAGIAHEIQNPLNFVNNFSDLNTELIEEAGIEMKQGNVSGAEIILQGIRENEEKINQHGKRADAIVKGMLQHSRSSTGVREPADINKLADEYLRLSYQGLRARDKSFNATLHTDFDESLDKIKIIPQDIGRVLLNLYNNAFYAVTEKSKLKQEGYEKNVFVATRKAGDRVEISVRDNGNGISRQVIDKIFQPFFTTKPTGQGTGLGLSLSYDIVKSHGGTISVESREGEYTQFIVLLPV